MKKKVLIGLATIFACCTMMFTFDADASQNEEVQIVEVRFRKDRHVEGVGLMQCVDLSIRRCEYVFGLHE